MKTAMFLFLMMFAASPINGQTKPPDATVNLDGNTILFNQYTPPTKVGDPVFVCYWKLSDGNFTYEPCPDSVQKPNVRNDKIKPSGTFSCPAFPVPDPTKPGETLLRTILWDGECWVIISYIGSTLGYDEWSVPPRLGDTEHPQDIPSPLPLPENKPTPSIQKDKTLHEKEADLWDLQVQIDQKYDKAIQDLDKRLKILEDKPIDVPPTEGKKKT